MKRLMVLSLAGLFLVSAVWAGEKQDKKSDETTFKVEGKLSKDDPADKIRKDNPHKAHTHKLTGGSVYVIKLMGKNAKDFDRPRMTIAAAIPIRRSSSKRPRTTPTGSSPPPFPESAITR